MTIRKEQAIRSKEKLLEAAKRLIAEKGYDQISVSDIAKACDMSVGGFYHYFSSKQDLIFAMERDPYDRIVHDLCDRQNVPLREQIKTYIDRWADLLVNVYGVNFNRQWFIYYLSHPTECGDPENKVFIVMKELRLCFESAIESGELLPSVPLDELTEQISFEIFGMHFYYVTTNGSYQPFDWAEKYCAMIDRILAPYYAKKAE